MSDARFHGHSRQPARRRGKKKGEDDQVLDRSRGGFSTRLHIAVETAGRPVELILSPGQAHDLTQASHLPSEHDPHYLIADQGYDSSEFLAEIRTHGSISVIPARAGRTVTRRLLRKPYPRHHHVERFVNRIRHFRRVATRYEKTARNFLGFVSLAALLCRLQ